MGLQTGALGLLSRDNILPEEFPKLWFANVCAGGAPPSRPPISMLKNRPRAEASKWTKVLQARPRLVASAQH